MYGIYDKPTTKCKSSSNNRTPDSCVREFLESEFRNSKDYTRDKCRWSLNRTNSFLLAAGFDINPRTIGEDAIEYFMKERMSKYLVSYQKTEVSYFNRYLRYFNNDVIDRMKIVWPQDMRVNADWLDDEQYEKLLNHPMTPFQEIVIHLELCMGLRNVECGRIMLNDIYDNGTKPYINVRGKGRGTGKYRSVRFHYKTREVLARWMEERAKIVKQARYANPNWQDPGTLLITSQYSGKKFQSHAFAEHSGAIDDRVDFVLREELGFHFSNHTLRRTFGRRLFHAGVPIETISKFLGHESLVETMKYLGLNLDDMDAGMSKLAEYDRKQGLGVSGK